MLTDAVVCFASEFSERVSALGAWARIRNPNRQQPSRAGSKRMICTYGFSKKNLRIFSRKATNARPVGPARLDRAVALFAPVLPTIP